jgi:hypothetical protein
MRNACRMAVHAPGILNWNCDHSSDKQSFDNGSKKSQDTIAPVYISYLLLPWGCGFFFLSRHKAGSSPFVRPHSTAAITTEWSFS